MGTVLYELSFRLESAMLIPLIMLIMIPLVPWLNRRRYGQRTGLGTRIFLGIIWCFVLAIAILVGSHQWKLHRTVQDAYSSGNYQTVEGYVENFDPMPAEGHKQESFDVSGVHFSYSDYVIQPGYRNARAKGGVISGNGQHLRIGYLWYNEACGNIIVYIEELPPKP